jgi:cyclopropane fatty-acyl-phospholipid synthase-like methyltransferase
VIEHVEEIRKFFRACHMLLKPGGLLFLTTDYWDAEGDDTAHFHWMRKRIYNAERMRKLQGDLRELGYASFGQADWAYHGPQVYDYAVCSTAMVKK